MLPIAEAIIATLPWALKKHPTLSIKARQYLKKERQKAILVTNAQYSFYSFSSNANQYSIEMNWLLYYIINSNLLRVFTTVVEYLIEIDLSFLPRWSRSFWCIVRSLSSFLWSPTVPYISRLSNSYNSSCTFSLGSNLLMIIGLVLQCSYQLCKGNSNEDGTLVGNDLTVYNIHQFDEFSPGYEITLKLYFCLKFATILWILTVLNEI